MDSERINVPSNSNARLKRFHKVLKGQQHLHKEKGRLMFLDRQ
jgi:hypothetical protein